jgi:hypothetical protein
LPVPKARGLLHNPREDGRNAVEPTVATELERDFVSDATAKPKSLEEIPAGVFSQAERG